ncbi:MAG: hypothetical protein JST82_12450 [Bacteroidetes bacterium]|nr:hypothetical protein [Bacteroidota bacterium]
MLSIFKRFNRADIVFVLLLLAAHVVFFLIALHDKKIYNGDSHEYIYMATNIKNQCWFYAGNPALPIQEEYMTLRPPAYPLFLCLVYFFTVNNWVVLILQNCLSIFNIYFLRHSIRMIGYSRKYDWIFAAFVLFYPSQFINTNIIAPDLFLQTATIFYFYFFLRFAIHNKWRYALGMSIALMLGVMIKPVLYPVVFFHAVVLTFVGIAQYKAFFKAFIAAVFPVIVVMSYGYVNSIRTGKLHFSSTQSFNATFYYYNFYKDTKGVDSAAYFLHNERAKIAGLKTFTERYDYANRRGVELLKQNFGPFVWYHLVHSLKMLIDPGKAEMDMFTGKLTLAKLYNPNERTGFFDMYKERGFDGVEDYMSRNPTLPLTFAVLIVNLLRLVGLVMFAFAKSIPRRIRLFTLSMIAYCIFIAGAIENPRYFMPVSLIAMGCAALMYQSLLQRYKKRKVVIKAEKY